jgi:YidC/Oxa1 family membrane protein insertase
MAFFDTILWPIMVAVAWIMVQFHAFFTWLGFNEDSGYAWVLSIVGLVIVIRIALIPLFVKQIKASRGMQMIQPEIQKIQAKYKGKTDAASRQAMQQETMAMYREAGTNPFSSCLPILAQSPIFFALFRVLNSLTPLANGTYPGHDSIGPLTQELASSAENATIFGAPLAATFMRASEYAAIGAEQNVKVVTVVLIVLMSATTFTTQRQLTMKNMPASALDNPMARQQKMLMYFMPLIFAFSGINFPIGVLLYWFTTNLWTMGQQFYVIQRMPTPGSEADVAMKARKARKAAKHGDVLVEDSTEVVPPVVKGQRAQPKRKDRQGANRPVPLVAPDEALIADVPGVVDLPGVADDIVPGATAAAGSPAARSGKAPGKGQPPASSGGRPPGSGKRNQGASNGNSRATPGSTQGGSAGKSGKAGKRSSQTRGGGTPGQGSSSSATGEPGKPTA